jgi:ADP-L-glycero-D-manno-heptose 6-epimerase
MVKKILITGNKGFIGTNLWEMLYENEDYELTPFELDGMRLGGFPDVKGYDTVIHLGAISSTIERNIPKILDHNYSFSMALLRACCEAGVDLQYASSASVYGNSKKLWNSEGDWANPQSPYAWSKYLFDYEIERMHTGLPIKVQGFRYFNVYGDKAEHSKGDQASPYTKWKYSDKIKLFHGSDKIKRDFINVEDVCKIHIKMLDVDQSGIFNVGTGVAVSFEDLAQHLSKVYNKEIEYMDMPEILKGQYQYHTRANLNKLKGAIGDYAFKSILDTKELKIT